jgi:trimethylamine--corrinoid protein Co-methyltransferase
VIDRTTRDTFEGTRAPNLLERACEQVERRLAAYRPVETDPAVDAAMRELIAAGLESQGELPELPPPPEGSPAGPAEGRRGRSGRRRHQ